MNKIERSQYNKIRYQKQREKLKLQSREYQRLHKKEIRKRKQGYGKTLKGRYVHYKTNAKRHNRDFKLSLFDFASIVVQPCAYCGKKDSIYAGIDRVDSSKGYIKENCVPCCAHCNMAKSNYSLKEFKEDIERRYKHIFKESKK